MIDLQRIIGQAIQDPASFAMLRTALSSSLAVANPHHRVIITFVGEFWDKYRALPKSGDYEFWTETLAEPQKGAIQQALPEVTGLPKENWTPEYIVQEVTKVLKEVAARNAVARLGTMVPNVPAGALETLAEEIKQLEPVSIHGLKDIRNASEIIFSTRDEEIKVATGIRGLDALIGGFKAELIFVLADSGIGKTTALVNFGAHACLTGKRVLHVTFELSAENTLKRYYRRVTESDANQMRNKPEVVLNKANHWLRRAKGEVHVLFQPAYSVGADEFEALVDQYAQVYGMPHLIISDYLDLMMPPKGAKSEYEGLGKLSHLMRNIGVTRDASMLTATQATRSANQARHIRLDHMGDSYNKVRAADLIITIAQTEEEFVANQARLGLPKVRENPGRGIEIPIFVNMDLMMISDLDSPNTRRIQEQLRLPMVHVFDKGAE